MKAFKFDIDDMLVPKPPTVSFSSPAAPGVVYTEHLRVAYRFCDGAENIYVVKAPDDIGLVVREESVMLEEGADPIAEKIRAKWAYLDSKGICWSEEEWKGYREGLEDMYNSQNK